MHTHLQHALCVCASCAVFNFLWPTASITINITQTRHALCPPPSAHLFLLLLLPSLPSVMLCSLSRMKNAIRIDIDANEKCQLFSRVAKESKLHAHSKQFEHEYEYEFEYECYTQQKKEKESRKELKSERGSALSLTLSTLNSCSFSFYGRV